MDDIKYACSRPGCFFNTISPYNYCPNCGSVLFIFEKETPLDQTINLISEDSNCPMAHQCRPTGGYDSACEQQQSRHQCLMGIFGLIESVESEIRMLRQECREAGLPVSPQKLSGRSARKVRETNNTGPQSKRRALKRVGVSLA